jgi:hypothetical protein
MRIMLHQTIIAEQAIPALARGWTPALKAKFLDHLATKGNVRASCARVGLSAESAYRLRRRDPDFARGWAAALALARDASVQVLADRAIDGIEERIFYRGELIDTRRRYDSRLLLAHIARLDRLVDEQAAGPDAARFDELLARIAGEEVTVVYPEEDSLLPCDRDSLADAAAEQAKDEFDEAWVEAAGGKAGRLGKAEYAAYQTRRELAALRARREAEAEWDEWLARARATVDALSGWPGSPPLPGLPGNPFPPPPTAAEPAAVRGGLPFPRTPSTVSTQALARALAGPATGFVPPATPRRPGARRTG